MTHTPKDKIKKFIPFFSPSDSLPTDECIGIGVEATKSVLDIAKSLNENRSNLKEIKWFFTQGSSLLSILNEPWIQVMGEGLPFISIGTRLLAKYEEIREKENQDRLKLPECAFLIIQAAYLESLQTVFSTYIKSTSKQKIDLINKVNGISPHSLEELYNKDCTEEDILSALLDFNSPNSKIQTAFNGTFAYYLTSVWEDQQQAETLIRQVSSKTQENINQSLLKGEEGIVKKILYWFQMGGKDRIEQYQSILIYLNNVIATQPLENIFGNEGIKFKDLYVPLQAQLLDQSGKVEPKKKGEDVAADPVDLETWVKVFLEKGEPNKDVIFIQGEPGRGKSVFCRMFADWIRKNRYPEWIPILIRLSEIPVLDKSIKTTLSGAVGANFSDQHDWLTDKNTRYFFLLDGFDELLMEARTMDGLKDFLKQISDFQKRCADNTEEMGHQLLITGRPFALYGVDRHLPDNLKRVEILPMNEKLQSQWFEHWQKFVEEEEVNSFRSFLGDDGCPEEVQELSQEPLLLYLLATMHHEKEINKDMFKQTDKLISVKVLIYEKCVEWVLNKQRPDRLNEEITDLDHNTLYDILLQAAVCAVQSGSGKAETEEIKERLKRNTKAHKMLTDAEEKSRSNSPLRNALATFYLRQSSKEGSVEFVHESFSEFLFAKYLKDRLEWFSKPDDDGVVADYKSGMIEEEIYDFLGYGVLSAAIVGHLRGLIAKSKDLQIPEGDENFRRLFKRLEEFYLNWWRGKFRDEQTCLTRAQKKMKSLKKSDNSSLRQVDMTTGLNTLILLLELDRYAKHSNPSVTEIQFYPCGNPEGDKFESNRLLRIIGYTYCSDPDMFKSVTRYPNSFFTQANLRKVFLRGVDLSGANFSGVDLRDADLSGANLTGVKLRDAKLDKANLSGANLSDADLFNAELNDAQLVGANLNDANLTHSTLMNTNFSDANLSNVNLSGSYIKDVNLKNANLDNISWDLKMRWESASNVDSARNTPRELLNFIETQQ